MKRKVGFLLLGVFCLAGGIFLKESILNQEGQIFDFFSSFLSLSQYQIKLTGDVQMRDQDGIRKIVFGVSGVGDGERNDLSSDFSFIQQTDKIARNMIFSGKVGLFREGDLFFLTPEKLSWFGGESNINNQFFSSLFTLVDGRSFAISGDLTQVRTFLKFISDKQYSFPLTFSLNGETLKLTENQDHYLITSQEHYNDYFFVKLEGRYIGDLMVWHGYWGKWIIDIKINGDAFLGGVSFKIVDSGLSLLVLEGVFDWTLNLEKKSLQGFSKPYSFLQDFLQKNKIGF